MRRGPTHGRRWAAPRARRRRPRRRLPGRQWLALGLVLVEVAVGCGGDGDGRGSGRPFEGEIVTIFGPEIEDEQESLKRSFAPLEEETGITIQLAGHRDFEERIDTMVEGGNPPDIAMFPQPGKVRDFVDSIVPLPDDPDDFDDLGSTVTGSFDDEWTDLVTVDTQLLAVPVKADFKSAVWYSPDAFRRHGYEVPDSFEEFLDLAHRMADDGRIPFCLGLESGFATGWPLTDWIEDFLLRREGPDLYEQWYEHEIPFDHPAVVAAAEEVFELLSQPGFVYRGLDEAAGRSYAEAGRPLLDDHCLMYRMANFYRPYWPEDTTFGPDDDVDAFYLPDTPEHPRVALVGGIYAAAFSDDEAVMRTMEYLASQDFADLRASTTTGGSLSPNIDVASVRYRERLDRSFSRLLLAAEPRYDASDLMPGVVGSSFWTAMVDVSTGETSVADAFAQIEASWQQE